MLKEFLIYSSGSSDLEEPVAIRPTSETVMYPCKFTAFLIFDGAYLHGLRLRKMDPELS